jgi:hypothetical protein
LGERILKIKAFLGLLALFLIMAMLLFDKEPAQKSIMLPVRRKFPLAATYNVSA